MGHTKWSAIQEAKGQHRRVVYVDNEAWETARAFASENLTSMSAVVRRGIMHITQRGAEQLDDQVAQLSGGAGSSEPVTALLEAKDEEIARLKRELAKRPVEEAWREGLKDPVATHTGFVDRATGDISLIPGRMSEDRRSRQKVIDEALRKVQKGKKP